MANIIDYLEWRGDIPFSADAFQEVDNLILSELSYTEFEGLVPPPEEKRMVSVQDVCDAFFQKNTEEEIMAKKSSTKVAPFLLPYLEKSKRFGSMKLMGYVNEIDESSQSQFSVVTFVLDDGTDFVAFRGTDSTLVGWREDFNMSYLYQTHGQKQAAAYLDKHFKNHKRHIRIGGHSKGGNFAVYASAFCQPNIQKKILQVYSNDGPGFSAEITKHKGYQNILPKVISTIPESSIVGLLLENEMPHHIVESSQTGAMQHDLMSWQVMGNRLVYAEGLSQSSLLLDKTLKRWIYGLEREEREEFVNILFDVLQSTGAVTIEELQANKFEVFNEISKSLVHLSAEKQRALWEVVRRLFFSGGETFVSSRGETFFHTEKTSLHLKINQNNEKTRENKRK